MGQFTEAKVGPLSISALIILIGAILGIIAVFVNWSMSTPFGTLTAQYSGWDFAFGKDWSDVSDFQKYMPFIAWIFAILTLIVAILPLFKIPALEKVDAKVWPICFIIGGLLMLIFSIVWGTWSDQGESMFNHASYGCWLMIVGAVLVMVGGILPLTEQLGAKKN
jgi:hypothetical protein